MTNENETVNDIKIDGKKFKSDILLKRTIIERKTGINYATMRLWCHQNEASKEGFYRVCEAAKLQASDYIPSSDGKYADSKEVKEFIKQQGWTQEKAAKLIGLKLGTFTYYLSKGILTKERYDLLKFAAKGHFMNPPVEPQSEAEKEEKVDLINKPPHYNRQGALESIDEMVIIFGEQAVMDFCKCNVWKYRYRAGMKNGAAASDDLAKSDWYMQKYLELEGRIRKGRTRYHE